GFPLAVDRTPRGVILHRGDVRRFAFWRALYELLHPLPSKRQAFDHTRARRPRGTLRAPPAGLAELTATQGPGERVLVGRAGGGGGHLPLADDLLAACTFEPQRALIASPFGLTVIEPPPSRKDRARAWLALTVGYARFVELRRRSLESEEAPAQAAFLREVERATKIRVHVEPFIFGHRVALPLPGELAPAALPPAEPAPAEHPASFLAPATALGLAGRTPD